MHVIEIPRLPQSELSLLFYSLRRRRILHSERFGKLSYFFCWYCCCFSTRYSLSLLPHTAHIVSVLSAHPLVVWFIWHHIFGIDITFNSTNEYTLQASKFMIERVA